MKYITRWGFLMLMFAVALVFFGSVICPPMGERNAEFEGAAVQYPLQEDPGTYKALPGELQIEERFPIAETPPPLPKDSFSTIEVTVIDDRGLPVKGARVAFLSKLKKGPALRASGKTNAKGEFVSPPLFRETYEVEASADFFFPVISDSISIPSESQTSVRLRLIAAARLSGRILTVDGKSAVHGNLSFTDLGTGVLHLGTIQAGGFFESPPLDAGNWSLAWKRAPNAEQDPRLRFALPLEPHQERKFQIVVPRSELGVAAPPKLDLGVEEIFN